MRKTLFAALILSMAFAACDKSNDPKVLPPAEAKIAINGVTDMTVQKNKSVTTILAVAPTGTTQEKTDLSVTGLPTGIWATFEPASGTPAFTTTLKIETNSGAKDGVYPIKIVGTTATGTKSYSANLTVTKDPCDVFPGKYTATYEWTGPAISSNTVEIKADAGTPTILTITDLFHSNPIPAIGDCTSKTINFTAYVSGGPADNYQVSVEGSNFTTTNPTLQLSMSKSGVGYLPMKVTLVRQ